MAALGAAMAVVAAGTSASAAQLETVTIAAPPFEPAALAFYAQDRGIFRKHGIEANVRVLGDPGATVAAVLSGDAQFAPGDVGGLLVQKSRGVPIKIVAGGARYVPESPAAALVSGPGKRFASARELVGKRIGLDRLGTIAYVALVKWLKLGGVRPEEVELSYNAFPDMVGLLTRGTIDAAVFPEPFLTAAKQQGARLVAPIFQTVCRADCLMTDWIARSDVDRALIARFRNAIQEAAVWANLRKNDAASGTILARYTQLQPSVIRKITRSRFATRLRLRQAQPWIDAYKEFGLIPATFTAPDILR